MIETKVKEIVSKFVTDYQDADSIDKVEIVMEVEDEFKIEISEEDFEKFHTVESIIEYVTKSKKDWIPKGINYIQGITWMMCRGKMGIVKDHPVTGKD